MPRLLYILSSYINFWNENSLMFFVLTFSPEQQFKIIWNSRPKHSLVGVSLLKAKSIRLNSHLRQSYFGPYNDNLMKNFGNFNGKLTFLNEYLLDSIQCECYTIKYSRLKAERYFIMWIDYIFQVIRFLILI